MRTKVYAPIFFRFDAVAVAPRHEIHSLSSFSGFYKACEVPPDCLTDSRSIPYSLFIIRYSGQYRSFCIFA